jgi:hypothetical protein
MYAATAHLITQLEEAGAAMLRQHDRDADEFNRLQRPYTRQYPSHRWEYSRELSLHSP